MPSKLPDENLAGTFSSERRKRRVPLWVWGIVYVAGIAACAVIANVRA